MKRGERRGVNYHGGAVWVLLIRAVLLVVGCIINTCCIISSSAAKIQKENITRRAYHKLNLKD